MNQIPAQPPSQNLPQVTSSPIIEWGVIIAAAIAGIRYLVKWSLDMTAKKEQGEFELMRSLITSLQNQVQTLLTDSRQSQTQLFDQIEIKDSMTRMSALLKDDVSRALGTQGAMYAKGLENQVRMEGKLDASLRQNDRIIQLLEQLVEQGKNADSE